ncbi:hypothetical protein ACB092_09G179800 [Castanea dentata]
MAATLNVSSFNNRDSLLGPNIKQGDIMNRTNGLNNHGLVGFQWQIMKEQDEDLEKLKETVTSTKHISLAVNEKLSLHTRILETWTSMWTQRIPTYRKSLARHMSLHTCCCCLHDAFLQWLVVMWCFPSFASKFIFSGIRF